MNDKFTKPYDPKATEGAIYQIWEKSGLFNPDTLPEGNGKPFTIIMPPTNANGSLHAGHALVMAIEDMMVRYKRMRGYKALWLPGLDHAGFETQVVYEKKLEKEGRTRFGMDPKQLYQEILDFTKENSNTITSQIRSMGASCDWSRQKFTLDEDVVKTVYATFERLEKDGLLYRGNKIVSWCPKHQTSFSDLEIQDEEKNDPLYYLTYGPFTIATTRPETKFGDKYVVMHPDDKRYAEYADGEQIEVEWINGPIIATIIKDDAIDMEFGTGAMTITPWHDVADFEIANRHGLEKEQVIDEQGKLLPIAGEFAGQHIKKARPLIVEKLKAKGLLAKVDDSYKHTVRTCYKCGTTIEPQIKRQWFVKMQPLAQKALEKIQAGEITYIPGHYKTITSQWLENIIDWNISRQIVWGIPIPAKICTQCGEGMVDLHNTITSCKACGGEVQQDPDTFDTWFSSGQWPFATLGFPDSEDYNTFYPTDVMETAGEIIFFWVSRMVMLGLYVTGKVPFHTVYLHGLVLDAKGQKMSKSKGNVINPLDLTAKYGTDALRMALLTGNTPGTSLALSEDKIKGYKNFANKLWNISRFIFSNTEGVIPDEAAITSDADTQLVKELREAMQDITSDFEAYRFHLATEKIYHYAWHRLADVILEESKAIFAGEDEITIRSRKQTLLYILKNVLIMLHPCMPFITEEIWASMPRREHEAQSLLLIEPWPIL